MMVFLLSSSLFLLKSHMLHKKLLGRTLSPTSYFQVQSVCIQVILNCKRVSVQGPEQAEIFAPLPHVCVPMSSTAVSDLTVIITLVLKQEPRDEQNPSTGQVIFGSRERTGDPGGLVFTWSE